MNFFQLFRIFSRFLAEFESDVYVLVLFEQGDDSLHRRDFAAVGFDDLDELADREDQYQSKVVMIPKLKETVFLKSLLYLLPTISASIIRINGNLFIRIWERKV